MKLLALLGSLRSSEHKEFEKFLLSPYLKASDQYHRFFKYLRKQGPDFVLDKAGVKTAFINCFGAAYFTETKFYNVVSGLSKQLERFLTIELVLRNSDRLQGGLFDFLLVRALHERNAGRHFRTEANQLIEYLQTLEVQETDDLWMLYQLHHLVYFNPDTPKFGPYVAHLSSASQILDIYFCTSKLRLAAEVKAREQILQGGFAVSWLDAVLQHVDQLAPVDNLPSLGIYRQILNLYFNHLDYQGYQELVENFQQQVSCFPKQEQQTMLRHLINGGIKLLNREPAVQTELFSLYKLAIEQNALLDRNRITPQSFVNIVNLAALNQAFQWAANFIQQNAGYLDSEVRQPTVDLARAGLFYNQKMLDEAQLYLTPEVFTVPPFDLLGRNLLLKIAFDRFLLFADGYEFLSSHMRAYERYVRSKPFTADKKIAEQNWIKFVRKLTQTKMEYPKVPANKKVALLKILQKSQPIVSKQWLAQKIEAL